jgi:hypothetical protein
MSGNRLVLILITRLSLTSARTKMAKCKWRRFRLRVCKNYWLLSLRCLPREFSGTIHDKFTQPKNHAIDKTTILCYFFILFTCVAYVQRKIMSHAKKKNLKQKFWKIFWKKIWVPSGRVEPTTCRFGVHRSINWAMTNSLKKLSNLSP